MDFCSNCGSSTDPDWVFCRSCGAGLDGPGDDPEAARPMTQATKPKVELISRGWDVVDVETVEQGVSQGVMASNRTAQCSCHFNHVDTVG